MTRRRARMPTLVLCFGDSFLKILYDFIVLGLLYTKPVEYINNEASSPGKCMFQTIKKL